jgi:hypothetical protein
MRLVPKFPPKAISTLSTIRKKASQLASQPASGAVLLLLPPSPPLPPCRSRQITTSPAPQPQGVSAIHSSRPVNFPSHAKAWQPKARQGTQHAATRLLSDAFPHPSFDAGQNSQPACPAPFSSRCSFRSNNNILGLLAPFTFVVTNRSTTKSVFRYRHFTIRLPLVVESRSILSTRLAVRRYFSTFGPPPPLLISEQNRRKATRILMTCS